MKKILILGGCGYIGNKLYNHLKPLYETVDSVDLEWFGNCSNVNNEKLNYLELTKKKLTKYNVVVLLAGHSSVPMCLNNRLQTFKNNVSNFVNLLDKLNSQKFIYASSSSLYNNQENATENSNYYLPANYYDLSKKEIDSYAQLSNLDWYGLRMGTVNGPSPNLRVDIMINKMYHSAINSNVISITNPNILRPILSIDDFCRAVVVIINNKSNPGLYNLASCNVSVEEIAEKVSKVINIPYEIKASIPSYNFSICTDKFCEAFNFKFIDTVQTITEKLHKHYKKCIYSVREGKNV